MTSIRANQLGHQQIPDTSAYNSNVEEVAVQDAAEAGTFCIMFDLSSKGCIEPEALVIDDLLPKPPDEADPDLLRKSAMSGLSSRLDEEARQNLFRARKQARVRELRLRVPAVGLGTTFLVLSTALVAGSGTTSYRSVLRNYMQHLGLYVLMLSLLPSDRRVVPLLATWLGIPLHVAYLLIYSNNVRKYMQAVRNENCVIDEEDYPCWFIMLLAAGMSVRGITVIVACTRIVCALKARMPSPELLLVVLSSQCQIYIMRGVVQFLWAVAAIPSENGSVALVFLAIAFGDMALGYFLGFALDFRSRLQSWFMSRGTAAVTAAGISELLGGQDIEGVLTDARNLFRFIQADHVHREPMQDNNPNVELLTFTDKGNLGLVDAFVSHSWHDDPDQKWTGLQELRADFKAKHSREPKLWIDKYCIDQGSIDKSLACLPVFLSGCSSLWILCGRTYLDRLWCIMEIMTFIEMGGEMANVHVKLLEEMYEGIHVNPTESSNSAALRNRLFNFDPRDATCTTASDTKRLQAVLRVTGHAPIVQLVHTVFK